VTVFAATVFVQFGRAPPDGFSVNLRLEWIRRALHRI
jgi:hypothetical protein